MTYNLTNFTQANGFLDVSIASNQLVGGWLFILVLLMVYVISFIALKRWETPKAGLTAGFILFVLCTSLWAVGLVADGTLVSCLIILVLSFVFSVLSE